MNVGVPQTSIVNLDEATAKSPSLKKGWPTIAWARLFSVMSDLLTALTLSGTTAQRPTTFLWIGRPYYDTTLGLPVWVHSVGPVVWHNGAGAVV